MRTSWRTRLEDPPAGSWNKVGECSAVSCLSVSGGETDRQRGPAAEDSCRSSPAGGERGGGLEQSSSSSSSSGGRGVSRQEANRQQKKKETQPLLHLPAEEKTKKKKKKEKEEVDQHRAAGPSPGLLTRQRGEDELRQRDAEQLDFRSLLGRRALSAKTTRREGEEEEEGGEEQGGEEEEPSQEASTVPMDFKSNLKGVKAKTEEERKANSPQQVDFRAVLAKKGAAGAAAGNGETPGKKNATNTSSPPPPSSSSSDFRSVLANKKKPASPEKNGDKVAVNNCVDGGIKEEEEEKKKKKSGEEAPEFVEKLSDVTVLDGQRLRLQCRLNAAAAAATAWTLDGKNIKSSKFIVLANEGENEGTCGVKFGGSRGV
ncbi:hypothetical protein EPR50_G00113740 [Perca flavescens]|uniref:Ig-like domain-containing protein n=1 Tax=Perca flavescens TaxID=8167 RepID=A0A484CSP1_PERFV|nr:hypothetical protein EPR50_G00113740 [Perca flavescens]